ncbi:MAG: putative conjugal transfer protein [Candidatus Thorarchaeota archaeon]|nr:MAG: putative conjugal transfer protein [Candidatus Thorarchaeota archaeon]
MEKERKYLTKIICHPERCHSCKASSNSSCMKQQRENTEFQRVILFEPTRGYIHFISDEKNIPTGPPWETMEWESVFIGNDTINSIRNQEIIDIYIVEPYIVIFTQKGMKTYFQAYPYLRTALEVSMIQYLSDQITNEAGKLSSRIEIDKKISQIQKDALSEISSYIPEMDTHIQKRLSVLISHKSTILEQIIPLILDDLVEEIFLDHPNSNIYFDHASWGRCHSYITINGHDAKRIITLIRSVSNYHLDRTNPSLKTEISFLGVGLRLSAALPPLSAKGLNLEIRRAKKKPLSMKDLILNGTLPYDAAALLLIAVNLRYNITITGAPGAGKTTLLNALDMTTPEIWRKIYIEDAIESRLCDEHHQVIIRVDPFDETVGRLDKKSEIVKTLHRSPDYLILGEIQTAEHTQALFQAMAAGLRSIQTAHSNSASNLITRWRKNHEIDMSNLAMMDLIVTVDKPHPGVSERYVTEIVEIEREENSKGIVRFLSLNTLYRRETGIEKWSSKGAFLKRFEKSREVLEEMFYSLINLIQSGEPYSTWTELFFQYL